MENGTLSIGQFRALFINCNLKLVQALIVLSNFTKNTTTSPLDANQILELLIMAHFIFPMTFFAPHCCKESIFHRLWSLFSKMSPFTSFWAKYFWLKYGPLIFFPLNRDTHTLVNYVFKCLQRPYQICGVPLWWPVLGIIISWINFSVWSSPTSAESYCSSRLKFSCLTLANPLWTMISAMAPSP